MSSAVDVIELTSFVADVDLQATYRYPGVAWKVITVGGGVLVIRTPGGDRTLTVAAGDNMTLSFSHVLVGTTVAKLQIAVGAP
jgi:hypothetical protein